MNSIPTNPEEKYTSENLKAIFHELHKKDPKGKVINVMIPATTRSNDGIFRTTIGGIQVICYNKCFFLSLQQGMRLSNEETLKLIKDAGCLNNDMFDTDHPKDQKFLMTLATRYPEYRFEIYLGISGGGKWHITPEPQYCFGKGKKVLRVLNKGTYHFELITNDDSCFVEPISEGKKAMFERDQQKEWQQLEDEKFARELQKQLEEEEKREFEKIQRKLEKEKEIDELRDEIVARKLQKYTFPGFLQEKHQFAAQREKELEQFFPPKITVKQSLPKKSEKERQLEEERQQLEREKKKLEEERAQFEREKRSFFNYQKVEIQKINEEKRKLEETLKEALENLSIRPQPFKY